MNTTKIVFFFLNELRKSSSTLQVEMYGLEEIQISSDFLYIYPIFDKRKEIVKATQIIQKKLHAFIRKYYTNELIKGSILFLTFGLLYFLFTLLIEYFLWLKPTARTILFWVFIGVEITLLVTYIFIPIFKLIGFSKGISTVDAAKIIGKHFDSIDDKLLNMLQLQASDMRSELAVASIDQKAKNLQPIPFLNAIQFSGNKKYIKYLLIPIFIWLLTLVSGNKEELSESYRRVVNHQQAFIPPAPFTFEISNPSLEVIEGSPLNLQVITTGELVPDEARIIFNEEDYFLRNNSIGHFSFQFNQVLKPISFYFEANNIQSKTYEIIVIPTPKIQGIGMYLDYPKYVNKIDEKVINTGNVIIPSGTKITWTIETQQTDSLHLTQDNIEYRFNKINHTTYQLTRSIRKSITYQIKASNQYLKDYENLSFGISVIQDELPSMTIQTDIDSISRGEAQFIGHLSDDYGLSKLQLVYYPQQNPTHKDVHDIEITKTSITDFYYIFPQKLNLAEGVDYEFYFEVFDNDAIAGNKSVKSKTYSYHNDTDLEVQEKLLEEQKKGLEDLQKTLEKQQKNQLDLDALQKELQNKSELEFNDTKKLEQYIKRQEEYQEMMQRQTEEIQRNLEEQPDPNNQELQEKKEDLQQRIEDAKKLAKEEKLLEELRKLAEKMQKEDLVDKIKKMSKNNKQKEKSLEQLLELTKRFYVEQKAQQISEKLEKLAKKQDELSEKELNPLAGEEANTKEKQEELNKAFDEIKKEMADLQKENKALKEPMDIDEKKKEQEAVSEDQQEASEQLEQQNQQKASKSQKSAAQKMRQMSKDMQMQMAGGSGEMIEEDIAMLRQIIENLITFSYKQENLMNALEDMHRQDPSFSKKLKEQNRLKVFFEHIDDSLYVLSMRQAKLSPKINEYLANAHYYLDETLVHYAEFQLNKAVSDQQYVMTAANDLALLLSMLLDNMQSSMSMGKGQGKGKGQGMGKGKGSGKGFGLPDIIKKQGELGEKIKKGMEEGEKGEGKSGKEGESGKEGKSGKDGKSGENGTGGKSGKNGKSGNRDGEESSQELYEIYKQQALLRQALEDQLNNLQGVETKAQANQVKKQMEQLEQMLLEKGITSEVVQHLQHLEHELLKLKEAAQEQGKENKRESKTNTQQYNKPTPKQLEFKNKYYKQNEILNREVLPMKGKYKKKVKTYFSKEEKK